MGPRLVIKLIVVLAVMLFMVMMGMSNQDSVVFRLMNHSAGPIQAALMFFIFFGVGVFTGGVLVLGPSGKGSSSSASSSKK